MTVYSIVVIPNVTITIGDIRFNTIEPICTLRIPGNDLSTRNNVWTTRIIYNGQLLETACRVKTSLDPGVDGSLQQRHNCTIGQLKGKIQCQVEKTHFRNQDPYYRISEAVTLDYLPTTNAPPRPIPPTLSASSNISIPELNNTSVLGIPRPTPGVIPPTDTTSISELSKIVLIAVPVSVVSLLTICVLIGICVCRSWQKGARPRVTVVAIKQAGNEKEEGTDLPWYNVLHSDSTSATARTT